jgi:hypothetical protein
MATKRTTSYFQSKAAAKTTPMKNKQDVAKSNDNKIDEDFTGFPDAPSKEKMIHPKTKQEKKTAAVDITDGEKQTDEQRSDGSGGAFAATEEVQE